MAVLFVSRSYCFAALAILLSPSPGVGDDRGRDADSAVSVHALVELLDAGTLAERAAAERSLQKLGPAALPYLPNPETLRASAADAVKRIRRQLEEQQSRQTLRPSVVTFQGTAALEDILAAMTAQTGNLIDISKLSPSARRNTLRVDIEKTPFWQAIRYLEEQTPITILASTNSRSLLATIRTDNEPVASSTTVAGPFRMDVLSATVRPDFNNPDRRLLRLTLEVLTEPRLRPLFIHMAAEDLTVNDGAVLPPGETLRAFPPLTPDASREIPLDKPGPIRLRHDGILPQENSSPQHPASVNVQGTIHVEVAVAEEQFTFRHLDEPGPITRRHGGVSVTLDEVNQTGSDLLVSLRLLYEGGGPRFESHRAWVYQNEILLVDGDDRQRPTKSETMTEGEGGAVLRYRFADVASLPNGVELRYTAPTLITRVPVEFSIDGIRVD